MEKRRITKFIKNEVGSNRVPEGGGSWIDYWFSNSTFIPLFLRCPICGCLLDNNGLITTEYEGAHIRLWEKTNKWSDKIYIVPMCHKCNCQFGKPLQVLDNCRDLVVVEEICKE